MTDIEVHKPAGEVSLPVEDMTGLEDFDQAIDAVMPTLRIEHKDGTFVDGLSGESFPELKIILLGLIKQRVLWEADMDESSKGPLCRSYDFKTGVPEIDRFPWKSSGFDKAALDADPELPCESCNLKDWGSHPKRDAPWCSEQHTFAVLQPVGDDGGLAPALLTVQRSAIKPSRTYMTSFARTKTPLYTVWTKITLDSRRKGSVDYAVPKFIRAEATQQNEWPMFAQQYRQIRQFVQTPRTRDEDENATPGAAPASDPTSSTSPTAPPAVDDDDELPF